MTFLFDGKKNAEARFIVTHGAGAAMDTPFMDAIAEGVAAHGVRVIRFEFPYMEKRREDGRRRPPNGAKILQQTWRDAIAEHRGKGPLFIGGKSMGGRIASQIADAEGATGLICLGFPFHPSGKPDKLRLEDVSRIKTPTLVIQGTRDALGNREEVAGYGLSKKVEVLWLEDGDHSLKPRKKSGHTHDEHLATAVEAIAGFIGGGRGA